MNTKPFQWMAVPFFNKEKITQEQTELQKRIDLETRDLKRIFYSRWTVFKSSFKKAKLFSFYESTLVQANNQLHSIKNLFEHNVVLAEQYRTKLWDFVLPSSQCEIIKINQQRAIQNQWVKNKAQAIENHAIVMEGTKAETDINNAHILALESASRLKKAEHHNKVVDNLAIEIELHSKYKAELIEKANHQAEAILRDNKRFIYESVLPNYPEPLNEQTQTHDYENKYQPAPVKELEKPTHTPFFLSKDKTSITHQVEFAIGHGPEYYTSEQQLLKAQQAYGMYFAKSNFPALAFEEQVELSTTAQKALDVPQVSETFLGSITKSKVTLTFIIVFLAMIPEYLIYSAIISAIFEFSGIKALLAGTVVLLFGKGNAMILYGTVLDFFKKQSKVFEFRKVKINRFFLFLFGISLVYCFAIGLLFKSYKDEQKATKEYVMLQQTTTQMQQEAQLDEQGGSAELNQELQKAKEEAQQAKMKMTSQSDSPSLLKVFTIGLSGAIVLLFSSCVFAMSLIFSSSYHLRSKLEKATKIIIQSESQFTAQKQAIIVFRHKAFHICGLVGELEFLRRLTQGSPKDALYKPSENTITTQEEINTPLPLEEQKSNPIT
ncbi:hypothetical protein [Flavobacterium sp.]|uniref:hypothetical protein n=1 Tax=Flavobacterium sp. TaxID=239 RepID=UPI002639975E|nr:hypothetical protein [Flavobacterium sp.]MDD2986121.1 hypothetical protein [Flavobacterium sp.]